MNTRTHEESILIAQVLLLKVVIIICANFRTRKFLILFTITKMLEKSDERQKIQIEDDAAPLTPYDRCVNLYS